MFKILKNFLFTDIAWKLSSLGLAFLMWFIAMNVDNPTSNHTFNRNLTLQNKEVLARDDVIIINERTLESTNITVTVRATQNDFNFLNAKSSNIVASIDLRSIDTSLVSQSDGPVRLPVDVDVNIIPGYERMSRWPLTVTVELDKKIQQIKRIQTYAIGEVADGYELQGVTNSFNDVIVSGARSAVEQVHTVRAQINVQGAEGDVIRVERLYAYNADEVDITNQVELSSTAVEIRARVLPYKPVELDVSMTNMPASGYTVTNVSIEPHTVNIVGAEEDLAAISKLTLRGIDLSDENETIVRALDIRQALLDMPGVTLKRDELAEAMVTVEIERLLVRGFIYPIEDIRVYGYPPRATVRLAETEPVTIAVRGVESIMDEMSASRLTVQLNLYGLEPGTHVMPLTVTLPRGFTLAGEPPNVEVIIQEADENPEGEPADGPPETGGTDAAGEG